MTPQQKKVMAEIRALLVSFTDLNEAQYRHFFSDFIRAGQLPALIALTQALVNRSESAEGVERVAYCLAAVQMGSQLERLLSDQEGRDDGE
jgi:hypothetical protein